jgi:S1-C subfamily serine protease
MSTRPIWALVSRPSPADIRTRYEIAADVVGVAVVTVDPRSKAAEAGVEPGDVIQRVQAEPVASVREFWLEVDGAGRDRRSPLARCLIRGAVRRALGDLTQCVITLAPAPEPRCQAARPACPRGRADSRRPR